MKTWERMLRVKHLLLSFLFGLAATVGAQASTADFVDLPDVYDPGPIFRLSGPDAMTLSAPGGFFPFGGVLFTDLDLDPVTIDFATPLVSVEVVGGLDDLTDWTGGEITISGGGGVIPYAVMAGAPTSLVFAPGGAFSSIVLTVSDVGTSSTVFIGIESITTTPIPLPGAGALLVGALAAAGGAARFSRARAWMSKRS